MGNKKSATICFLTKVTSKQKYREYSGAEEIENVPGEFMDGGRRNRKFGFMF
jgi:hypothetical protein